MEASIRQVDLVRREADLALRASKPVTRDLLTLASVEEPVAAFASRAYVKTLPPSPSLADFSSRCARRARGGRDHPVVQDEPHRRQVGPRSAPDRGIYLVRARSALAVPRVRAVADLLAAELSPEARVPRADPL